MSKKSVVRGARGFGWKVAVAALVVAGVVGTAGAASLFPTADAGPTGDMGVAFEVKRKAIIECDGKKPDREKLLSFNALDSVGSVAISRQDPGSLGTIKVATNASSWDINMTTANGGRLVSRLGGKPTQTCSQPDPWDASKCLDAGGFGVGPDTGGSVDTLKFTATPSGSSGFITSTNYVQLEVSIGLAYLGSQMSTSAPQTNLYAIGAPSSYVKPAPIASGDLEKTGKVVSTVAPSAVPISFASVIGPHYAARTSILTNNAKYFGRDWSGSANSVEQAGFVTPNHTLGPTDEQYFFINVGLNQTLKSTIGGNKDGNYTETFIFELVGNY